MLVNTNINKYINYMYHLKDHTIMMYKADGKLIWEHMKKDAQ